MLHQLHWGRNELEAMDKDGGSIAGDWKSQTRFWETMTPQRALLRQMKIAEKYKKEKL